MAHRIDYLDGGTRARVTLDLDGASLDSDANPVGSQWQTLNNVLTNIPGILTKRGAIVNAASNSTNLLGTSGALTFHGGIKQSSATNRPYYGLLDAGTSLGIYLQHAASGTVTIDAAALHTNIVSKVDGPCLPTSKCPTIFGSLVVGGQSVSSSVPGPVTLLGGSVTAIYSTGTVATTALSTTVTGTGTSWTSAHEGGYFRMSSDLGGVKDQRYRVVSVESSTKLTLDRAYMGTAGSPQSYEIGPYAAYIASAAVWESVSAASFPGIVHAGISASAYQRVLVGDTMEYFGTVKKRYPNRLRWSGVVGSDEGTSPSIGIHAYSADGYIDLESTFGTIVAIAPSQDSVLVFQTSGLTVLHGNPVFDGAGSLDVSEIHPNVSINGGFAFESTSQGVFFFDSNVGPCVYDGTQVQRIGDARVTRTMLPYGIKHVGYYDGKVLFSGETLPGIFVFDTRTAQWSLQIPPAIVKCLIAGRVENDEDVVGLAGGVRVVNLTNMFDNPGVAATDWDSSSFVVDVKTGKLGDAITQLRPERMFITYRLTDLSTTNPYLTTTVTTGLPDTSDTAHTYSNASTALVETTDVETKVLEIMMDRDPMAQVRVLQTNAAGKLELYSIVVDCTVEGEGAST